MDRDKADKQLTELSKYFIRQFKDRVNEFDQKDLEDMRFLCVKLVALCLECKERDVRPNNAYIMLGIMTSYLKIAKDVIG